MSTYVFDQAWESERARLAGIERWHDPGTIRHLEALGVTDGWRCLEVGGGGGSIAAWLSERVGPKGSVVATDLDTRFLETLGLDNLEVRRHDILADELPSDEFDLAHTRMVLMHLPERDKALGRMIAALKPGGVILVEDMDFITWIEVGEYPAMARVREAMLGMFGKVGADPFLGRRLARMLIENGLADVEAEGRAVFGPRTNNPGFENFRLTLLQLREVLVSTGAATAEDVDEALRLVDDPGWFGMPPTVVAAWGRKPG